MPRSLIRVFVVASALACATIALSGCAQASSAQPVDNCGGVISKVLLTDDSATTVTAFHAAELPKAFNLPTSPAPTCYYSDIVPPQQGNVAATDTHRTLLYIGLSDSQAASIIASIRKTVSVAPWTVRFDYGAPVAPTASPSATPAPTASTSSSARWYYNFSGAPADDKGELGYYLSQPVTRGVAIQAGLTKPVNVLRIETELKQVKK